MSVLLHNLALTMHSCVDFYGTSVFARWILNPPMSSRWGQN